MSSDRWSEQPVSGQDIFNRQQVNILFSMLMCLKQEKWLSVKIWAGLTRMFGSKHLKKCSFCSMFLVCKGLDLSNRRTRGERWPRLNNPCGSIQRTRYCWSNRWRRECYGVRTPHFVVYLARNRTNTIRGRWLLCYAWWSVHRDKQAAPISNTQVFDCVRMPQKLGRDHTERTYKVQTERPKAAGSNPEPRSFRRKSKPPH